MLRRHESRTVLAERLPSSDVRHLPAASQAFEDSTNSFLIVNFLGSVEMMSIIDSTQCPAPVLEDVNKTGKNFCRSSIKVASTQTNEETEDKSIFPVRLDLVRIRGNSPEKRTVIAECARKSGGIGEEKVDGAKFHM
ncbi:hypothetical protein EVAR_32696_1 [Eumeta japonica]|uniref:Uncharacterized protein n=1 Tax=Eumeta variegata TaxID=151549 RepID=A0A4C1VPR7_EUMVA|nr:hypothetical protein EVAR_32696_1 [Eumeta japonica]